jgi:Plant transposon protein
MLCTGSAADEIVDNYGLAESTLLKFLERFCTALLSTDFVTQQLRLPTVDEMRNIERRYERLGFPGSLGCIDCSGVEWKMCPTALHGVHTEEDGNPVLRMEVLSDDYCRIVKFISHTPQP